MVAKRLLSAPMLLLAGGCAFVGPIYDRSFESAPHSACAQFAGAQAPAGVVGQKPVGVGCFDAVARTMSSYGSASPVEHSFTADGLAVTDNAAFRLRGGEGCTGMFTNFVVEYSTPEGGAAMLTATDALGRPLGMERIRADASPKLRRTVMREMGDPLKDPAVLEISNVEGTIMVRSVCLKGY
jgi:hypothetical protein